MYVYSSGAKCYFGNISDTKPNGSSRERLLEFDSIENKYNAYIHDGNSWVYKGFVDADSETVEDTFASAITQYNDAQLGDVNKIRIVWFSDAHLDTNTDKIERLNWMIDRINATAPDLVLFTGDAVEGASTTSTATADKNQFIAAWPRINPRHELLLGNRDTDLLTAADWITAHSWSGRKSIVGSQTNNDFTISKNGTKVRVIMWSYKATVISPTALDKRYWVKAIQQAKKDGVAAVLICTHDGSNTYAAVDAAVNEARATSDIPVYHLFNHHHPLASEMVEAKTLPYLTGTLGINYTAPGLKAFILPGLQDDNTARFANIAIDKNGNIEYSTTGTTQYFDYNSPPAAGQTPYYWIGTENVAWIAGEQTGIGLQSKESEYLSLEAGEINVARRAYVTNVTVDLTSINKLYIDWDGTGTLSGGSCILIASTSQMGSHSTYNAILTKSAEFVRQVHFVDVSSLTGQHYIRVHARDSSGSAIATSKIKVYRVWGE